MLRAFLILACAGFVLTFAVHVAAIAGIYADRSVVGGLALGMFAVFLAAARVQPSVERGYFWRDAFDGCPPWVRIGCFFVLFYAGLHFVFAMLTTPRRGSPGVVHKPGDGLAMVSAALMFFYAFAFATLYSARVRRERLAEIERGM